MNCGSSAGTIENPARPRISAAHMAATTGAEGAAVADRARVMVPNEENPGWGNRGSGVDDRAGGIAIDRLVRSKHRRGPGCPHLSVGYPQVRMPAPRLRLEKHGGGELRLNLPS